MSSSVQTRNPSPEARRAERGDGECGGLERADADARLFERRFPRGSRLFRRREREDARPFGSRPCRLPRETELGRRLAERAAELPAEHVVDLARVSLGLHGVDDEELHPAIGHHERRGGNLRAGLGEEALERAGKRRPREGRAVRSRREGVGRQRTGQHPERGRGGERRPPLFVGGADVHEPVARQDERVRGTRRSPERGRERIPPAVTQRRSPC